MSFINFVVKRYIFSKRKFQFISFIAWLSVLGITIGVAALIIVMSIFNGFREMQQDQLSGKSIHLEIYSNSDSIFSFAKGLEGVENISRYNESKVLLSAGEALNGGVLVTYQNPDFLDGLSNNNLINNSEAVLIGGLLAQRLKVFTGDQISLTTPEKIKKSIVSYRKPKPEKYVVAGTFYTNSKSDDNSKLIRADGKTDKKNFSSIALKVANPDEIEIIKNKIQKKFVDVELLSWKDKNSQLLGIMEFERYATFIILGLIILIAAFNLFVSISMTVLEKEKDIAIIRVLGSEKNTLNKIFFRLGFFTGSFGTILGLTIGLLVIFTQMKYGWIPVANAQNIIMPDIPINANPVEISLAVSLSLVLTAISSYLPGRYILRKQIISGIAGDN